MILKYIQYICSLSTQFDLLVSFFWSDFIKFNNSVYKNVIQIMYIIVTVKLTSIYTQKKITNFTTRIVLLFVFLN